MDLRPIGTQGMTGGRMGFGVMNLGGNYGAMPDRGEALRVVAHAVDRGVTLYDTAEVYGPYENEILAGEALRPYRNRISITTKFGWRIVDGKIAGTDSSPAAIRASCEGSLKRLGIETIDLYYQHRVDRNTPIEDVAGTIKQLIQEGKVRHFGLSEPGEDTLRRAHAIQPVTAIENEYSLWTRDPETWALATCRELGIGLVAYSPLGRGFLTGTVDMSSLGEGDNRADTPRFQADAMAANARLVAALTKVAEAKGCSTGQLALAWLLHQGDDIFPIPGTRRIERIDENVAATQISLSAADRAAIAAAFPADAVTGARYNPEAMVNLAQ